MVRQVKFVVTILLAMSTLISDAFAQTNRQQEANQPPGQVASAITGPRRQLATIVFAGLGGAILGLSTLSFYGRPQTKLNNIAIGFAFGIIGGTIYVTYKAAMNPAELYSQANPMLSDGQNLLAIQTAPLRGSPIDEPHLLSLQFDF